MSVDNTAANWCSKALGEGEIEEWHEGFQYGSHQMRDGVNVQRQRVTRRAVLSSEFTDLKTGQGYIKVGGFNPSKFKASSFTCLSNIASPFVENVKLVKVLKEEIAQSQRRRILIEEQMKQVKSGEKIDPNFTLEKAKKAKPDKPRRQKLLAKKQNFHVLKKDVKIQPIIQSKQKEICINAGIDGINV